MRNKLIDELEKMIELLHQTGWHKQAVWYENKLKLIKEGEEDCESFSLLSRKSGQVGL